MKFVEGYYQHASPVYTEHSAAVRLQALESSLHTQSSRALGEFTVRHEGDVELEG